MNTRLPEATGLQNDYIVLLNKLNILVSKARLVNLSIDESIGEEIQGSSKNTGVLTSLDSSDHDSLLSNDIRGLKKKCSPLNHNSNLHL